MSGPDRPRRGRRLLGPDERRLWDRVAATADPLKGSTTVSRADGPTGPEPDVPDVPLMAPIVPPIPKPQAELRPHRPTVSKAMADLLGPEVGPVGKPEPGLDRRTSDRLRKGARTPDATIDLHGMSAERAHRACLTFLSDALRRGARVVLVITGKGGRRAEDGFMPSGRGVLRDSLPGWLRASPLGHSIVGIYQAHQKHGGGGAFYVYLKKRR